MLKKLFSWISKKDKKLVKGILYKNEDEFNNDIKTQTAWFEKECLGYHKDRAEQIIDVSTNLSGIVRGKDGSYIIDYFCKITLGLPKNEKNECGWIFIYKYRYIYPERRIEKSCTVLDEDDLKNVIKAAS